jgi:phosphoribosylformylglycinamidine synthase
LEEEKRIQDACLEMIHKGLIKSAHDCSEGGLAVALAECCISSTNLVGANINLDGSTSFGSAQDKSLTIKGNLRPDALLFGESQSRIVVTIQEKDLETLKKITSQHKIPFSEIGRVGGEKLRISLGSDENVLIDLPVTKLMDLYDHSIGRIMEEKGVE